MSETAVVTLLFTDLVGSTELSQRLGEDAAEVLRSEHTAVLRDAVDASSGREVKHLGDGLMVVFTSPSEAVRCAVAMQQGVHRHNRKLPDPLGLRVGLHVGEVTVKEDDYFGTAVVVAERLSKKAGGGQIVASDVVRSVVGTRGGHRFSDLGPLELKGIDEPVAAYALLWEPAAEEELLPLPPLFRSVERLFFVGRTEEYERLERAWKLAVSGERQVALLSGEPGIGKTRTSTELAFHAYDQGAIVLYGRCDEDPGIPYQPFAEALRHYVAHCSVDDLREHVANHSGELARIVPDLAKRVPDAPAPMESDSIDPQADREAERYRLFEAAAGMLHAATDHAPVLLVLDDLHWATRPTLLLLRHLLRGAEDWPLLILGTYRDTDLARTHPLAEMLADWRRELPVDRIALGGLDESGALAYVEAAAGERERPELAALAHALHAETEGNPFFMGQVLRHLSETGVVYQEAGRWTYDGSVEQLGIPEGVREVVGRRLSRLSESANKVLSVAAVVGTDFDLSLLERVPDATSEGSDVLDALDEAMNARVIVELPDAAERYRFTHTLVRQTLYEELSSARRSRLHQRVGEAIESTYGSDLESHIPALARHFAEGARAGNLAKAADYSIRAAQQALTRAAYEEAIQHAQRGLQVLDLDDAPHDAERAALWLVIAESRAMLLDSEACADAALQAGIFARRSGHHEQITRATTWFAIMSVFIGRADEAVRLVDEALSVVTESFPGLRSQLLSTKIWCGVNLGSEGAGELSLEAIALARRAEDLSALGWAMYMRGYQLRDSMSAADALVLGEEAVEVGRSSGDPWTLAQSLRVRRPARLAVGDRHGFEEDGAEIARIGEQMRMGLLGAVGLGTRAVSAILDGRYDESEGFVEEYISRWRSIPLLLTHAVRMMGIRWEQGQLEEVETLARRLIELSGGTGPFGITPLALMAAVDAARGDLQRARDAVSSLAPGGFERVRLAPWSLTPLSFLSEACAELGDADAAATIRALFAGRRNELPVMGDVWLPTGSIDRYVAILAATMRDFDEAEQRFDAALAFEEAIPAPAFASRSRYWYARMLLLRGDNDDEQRAKELLDECIRSAAKFGMKCLEANARALIT